MVATALTGLLGVLWYVAWTVAAPGPVALGYLFMPVSMALGGLSVRSLRRATTMPPAGRRFWLLLEICCHLFAAGFTLLAVAAVRTGPELPAMPRPARR
ncbi:hypothetical protein [Actinoplanes sp. NPDC049802]|uniref:hypothetical protein n=1 Tax=Actinoplanes sp. NPDC049802 TaxID=3154742 RepID=UPI0033FBB73E